MDYLKIQGNAKLNGSIDISGAKNAALPLIAMSILAKDDTAFDQIMAMAAANQEYTMEIVK